MPIEPPHLDDLRYDAVVEDLVRRIPVYAPTWTDHNDSDPGITLIQLFAQLAEQIGYRLDRVPELAHVALLELLGIELRPAGTAGTLLALLFDDPTRARATVVAAGTVARAKAGKPPPVFTTDGDHDLVPADVRAVLSTKNPFLHDVLLLADGTREHVTDFPDTPADQTPWLSVRWDGRKPKAADLPKQPAVLLGDPAHGYVWLGLGFDDAPEAGFLDVRVDLWLQFDDTEQPTLQTSGPCGPPPAVGEAPGVIDWLWYWDAQRRRLVRVPGRIDDGTDGLSRSGTVRFAVPATLGAIAADQWVPMQTASAADALTAAGAFARALGDSLADADAVTAAVNAIGQLYRDHFRDALQARWQTLATPPPLNALLTDIRDSIVQRLSDTWTLPNVDAVRDDVIAKVLSVIADATVAGDFQALFNALRDIFLQPIIDALTNPFATVTLAVDGIQGVIDGIDLGSTASALHVAIRDWVAQQLALAGPITVAQALRQDIADYYYAAAVAALDAVFGTAPATSRVGQIADYYRQAALGALDDALEQPPTAAVTQLVKVYSDALASATDALEKTAATITPFVDHPLPARYRDPGRYQGWLRLTVPAAWQGGGGPRLRYAGFNVVAATNAELAGRIVLGSGDGRPGLELRLPHGNILAGTLELAVQESADPAAPLVPWRELDDLGTAGPFDRVFELDREAGTVRFGDGTYGRIPPLVPGAGAIVVHGYRHGGGAAGNVPVGAVTSLEAALPGVAGVVNVVAAEGGRDAEDLEAAKVRARRDLATRYRAVTAEDFEWIALQTPTVNVARAVTIGLRRPLPPGTAPPAPTPLCGPALPDGPTGIEDGLVAHGVVSVVVVPQEKGPEPLPAPSFLTAVCRWLDQHRLVTTELYVIPPQYVRLCNLRVTVQPRPGHTRVELQDRVGADLGTYLHVLTGGDDGSGFPFGGQLHVADLISRVARLDGVERVEDVRASFTRTRSSAAPRQGELVLCPAAAGEFEALQLSADESVSLEPDSVLLTTVAP